MLTGSRFQGISQASGGNGQDSSTNYPVVQLRNIDNSQVVFLRVDPSAGWSDTAFGSTPVNNFPSGPALATVFTNGIPSDSKYLLVATPDTDPDTHTPNTYAYPHLHPHRPQRPHLHPTPTPTPNAHTDPNAHAYPNAHTHAYPYTNSDAALRDSYTPSTHANSNTCRKIP